MKKLTMGTSIRVTNFTKTVKLRAPKRKGKSKGNDIIDRLVEEMKQQVLRDIEMMMRVNYFYEDPPMPYCAVCKKEVDEMHHMNPMDFIGVTYRKYLVFCHGQSEVTELSYEMIKGGRIERGVAFKDQVAKPLQLSPGEP